MFPQPNSDEFGNVDLWQIFNQLTESKANRHDRTYVTITWNLGGIASLITAIPVGQKFFLTDLWGNYVNTLSSISNAFLEDGVIERYRWKTVGVAAFSDDGSNVIRVNQQFATPIEFNTNITVRSNTAQTAFSGTMCGYFETL